LAREFPSEWKSISCFDSKTNAKNLRETLDDLEMEYSRDKDEKHYNRLMVVIPLPQFAYVFKFIVKNPDFEIWLYDSRPTHSGIYHHVEVKYLSRSNIKAVKKVLRAWAKNQKRKPYKFLLYDRIRTGIILPEFLVAKRKWRQMGVK